MWRSRRASIRIIVKLLNYPDAKKIARQWLSGTEMTTERVDKLIAAIKEGVMVSIDDVRILKALVGHSYQQEEEAFRNCR